MTQHPTPCPALAPAEARLAGRPGAAGRKQGGFLVVELLVAVAILAVKGALASPPMARAIREYQSGMLRGDLAGAMELARMEAQRRSAPMALERLTGCGVTPADA